MDANSLIEILNCPRLRRLANFMRDQKKQIGIPVSPNNDLISIGANLVLGVLTKEIPRKGLRTYLLKLVAIDEIAKILRDWRSDVGQTVMHLIAAQYDLYFVKLIAEKCGEDFFLIQSSNPNDLPICHILHNPMIKQYKELKKTIEYHLSKVPNGASWIRSSIFNSLSKDLDVPFDFINEILGRPIIVSEIDAPEKEAVKAFFRTPKFRFNCFKDPRQKFITIFLLSEPSYFQCQQSDLFSSNFSSNQPYFEMWNLFEEIKQMKQLTVQDQGYLLSMANMTFDYVNGYFSSNEISRRTEHLILYVKLLWTLNDVGALPKTPKDVLNATDCEKLLSILAKQSTSGILLLENLFQSCDLPPSYKYFINECRKNRFTGPCFGSNDDLSFKFPFMDLPRDMMVQICSYMPYRTLLALLLTSKQLVFLENLSSIWRSKFEQYFPYDSSIKDYSKNLFGGLYTNKFNVHEIYIRDSFRSTIPSAPSYCDRYSVELVGDEIVYTSRHFNSLTVLNLVTNNHVTANNINQPAAARIYGDKVFVMKKNEIEVRDKTNLEVISHFSTLQSRSTLAHFQVLDNWLVASDGVYDWGTGQVLDPWHQDLHSITVRDRLCYGIYDNNIVFRDLRQSDRSPLQTVSNGNVKKNAPINVFDGKIYTAGDTIDIFDTRYLQKPTATIEPRRIGPCDSSDMYAIDLVNMNVWGSQVSWDLIDNKWEAANIGDYFNIVEKVCNGRYLAVLYVGVLLIYRTTTSATFPFGDFAISRYYC